MKPEDKSFMDQFKDPAGAGDQASMSDEELLRLMGGGGPERGAPRGPSFEDMPPGTRVRGTVLELQRDALLVELDRKTLGEIDPNEFGEDPPPPPGAAIQAEFVRWDRRKGLAILSVGGVRTEVAWEDLRPGQLVEGTVIEAVKGGLVLDLKGMRAFLPVSQVSLARIEDLQPYIGQKLRCEVQEVDRASRNIVVSRRTVLERERAVERKAAMASIAEGQVRTGTVARVTEHGAFVSLGPVDGLLHISRMREAGVTGLQPGQVIEVEVLSVDQERGRVSLAFHHVESGGWDEAAESYKVGEKVTGWVSKVTAEGAVLKLEEGVEAVIPAGPDADLPEGVRAGAIVKGVVARIDRQARKIIVKV